MSELQDTLRAAVDRVEELERERAMYEDQWRKADHERTELMARLAQARVEGARRAYLACREMMIHASPLGTDEAPYAAWIRAKFPEFDREYPATREEPTPAATAAPEPYVDVDVNQWSGADYVRITPDIAKRIVAPAQTTEG